MARPRLTLGQWWICLDTETTGLTPDPAAGVVEVAAALVNPDGTVVQTWSSLVQHELDGEQRADAEAVHGITRRMARFGPAPDQVGRQLGALRSTWAGQVALSPLDHGLLYRETAGGFGVHYLPTYAWNSWFDEQMVGRQLGATSGLGRPDAWGPCLQLWTTPLLYAAGMPEPEDPTSRRHERAGLQDAAAWLELPPMGPPHRALSDVLTTVAVVTAMQTGAHPGSKTWRGR